MFFRKRSRVIAATVAAIAIGGGSYGIVAATSSSASATPAASTRVGGFGSGGGANARSGLAAGGASGTVSSVSSSALRTENSRVFQPSLGYEPYDVRLCRLGRSPIAVLASADSRLVVVPGLLRLPVLPCPAASGLQIGLQKWCLTFGFLSF
jgi:hypothetical protein